MVATPQPEPGDASRLHERLPATFPAAVYPTRRSQPALAGRHENKSQRLASASENTYVFTMSVPKITFNAHRRRTGTES